MVSPAFFSLLAASLSASSIDSTTPFWINERLAPFNLQIASFPETGRGLQTTRDRSPGDVLIAVNVESALTASFIFARYPFIRKAAQCSVDKFNQRLTDEQILSLGLLRLRQDGDRYACSLPQDQYSVLSMPKEIKQCFPRCYQQLIDATCFHVNALYDHACQVLEGGSSPDTSFSRDDFYWAFATVRSRSVGLAEASANSNVYQELIALGGGGELRAMLPALCLLNHKVGAKSSLDFCTSKNEWTLRSMDAYQAGDQVCISYGDERNNLKTLLTYGFCFRGNPQAVAFFDTDDLFHACATVRPNIFPPLILKMLRKQQFLGDNHALFTLNGASGKPQADLAGGVYRMKSLAGQLLLTASTASTQGVESLTATLEQEIMNCMIKERKAELSDCLETIGSLEGTLDDVGWEAFLSSIRVLIDEENSFLQTNT
jgi:hypothetical protein